MLFLEVLDLHSNHNGSIPEALGSLSKLQLLDLSENSLSETVPSSIGNLKNLVYLNVSSDLLSGAIPLVPKLRTSAFLNNSKLCGPPLDVSCSPTGKGNAGKTSKLLITSVIVAIVAAVLILTGVCMVMIMNVRTRNRRREDETVVVESTPLGSTESNVIIGKLVLFSKSLPSRYEDWEAGSKALLDKECLIGDGSIGTVDKANSEGGVSIAVKKLETLGRIRNQDEFEQEIGCLTNLRHRNLVALQGYYWSPTVQLVLTEYISNGNLSDYGLGKLLPIPDNHGLTRFHNAVGYVAPKLAQSLRLSEKCDVYSYGVLLLELVTGRKPAESPKSNEVVVLREYVRELLETGPAADCFDRRLRGFSQNELIQVMRLGLICTSEVSARRPSMAEVVQILESI